MPVRPLRFVNKEGFDADRAIDVSVAQCAFYVNSSGTDSGSCGMTAATPCATIAQMLTNLPTNICRICVSSGVYSRTGNVQVTFGNHSALSRGLLTGRPCLMGGHVLWLDHSWYRTDSSSRHCLQAISPQCRDWVGSSASARRVICGTESYLPEQLQPFKRRSCWRLPVIGIRMSILLVHGQRSQQQLGSDGRRCHFHVLTEFCHSGFEHVQQQSCCGVGWRCKWRRGSNGRLNG